MVVICSPVHDLPGLLRLIRLWSPLWRGQGAMRDAFHSAGWKLRGLARQGLSSLPNQPGYQHQGLNLPCLAGPGDSHTAKAVGLEASSEAV